MVYKCCWCWDGPCSSPRSFRSEWNPLALAVVSACTMTLTLLQRGLIVYMWFNGHLFISPACSGVIHTAAARTFIGLEVMSCRKLLAEHRVAFTRDLTMAWVQENHATAARRLNLWKKFHSACFMISPSVKCSHVGPWLCVYCDLQKRDSSIVIVGKYEPWLKNFCVFVLLCSAKKNKNLMSHWESCRDSTAFRLNWISRFFINQIVVTARFAQHLIIALVLHQSGCLKCFVIQFSFWPLDLFLSCLCFLFPWELPLEDVPQICK